jgi:hypothetical protein
MKKPDDAGIAIDIQRGILVSRCSKKLKQDAALKLWIECLASRGTYKLHTPITV